ncbi:MAG: bifunctional phosphopantothenoylcysteine decarboxylase/phosphopantothenate--cysteine ligase CoaBC [Deltaproteobacteria bacterium]|nr:bifunctional phosphopantothenoylcysteine decarboxylase/phosphopantothenate--cysteine ligase CoaBC [Deltaproteobacteria bacterium]
MVLRDKKIVLGVTGAISAYKALELTRLLVKAEATVWPIMTKSAREFITPLSLSTLAKNPVHDNLFELAEGARISHIDLADKADLVIAAPATANIIGKIAAGIADDLLTTVLSATTAPVLIAPSMNCRMWENKIVRGNCEKLKSCGYHFVGPASGELACGYEGKGRLSPVEEIMEAAEEALSKKDLKGEKVLVSAGPTREAIDPVRFVSNASSGRMGYAIARAARRRGAEVVLVSGPSYLPRPANIEFVQVVSAEEMNDACVRYFPQSTLVIMSAAIADYRPTKSYPAKVKKDAKTLSIDMERTTDVLKSMGRMKKNGQLLVGFALETENIEENARKKRDEKNLDLVVANTPAGLDSPTNQVAMIDREGETETLPPLSKDEIAERILDAVVRMRGE